MKIKVITEEEYLSIDKFLKDFCSTISDDDCERETCPLCYHDKTGSYCIYYNRSDLNEEELIEIIDKIKKYMKDRCQRINNYTNKRYSKGIEVIVEKN